MRYEEVWKVIHCLSLNDSWAFYLYTINSSVLDRVEGASSFCWKVEEFGIIVSFIQPLEPWFLTPVNFLSLEFLMKSSFCREEISLMGGLVIWIEDLLAVQNARFSWDDFLLQIAKSDFVPFLQSLPLLEPTHHLLHVKLYWQANQAWWHNLCPENPSLCKGTGKHWSF